jgi:hypothetical protein
MDLAAYHAHIDAELRRYLMRIGFDVLCELSHARDLEVAQELMREFNRSGLALSGRPIPPAYQ